MPSSLQDQLLNAGLSDAKKAKQVAKDKRKQKRTAKHNKGAPIDEVKLAAQQARDEKVARDRELNRARNEAAERKAIEAQINQLIDSHKLDKRGGDVGFNFSFEQKIKKLYVTQQQQRLLAAGRIVIVNIAERFELLPETIGSKIAERDASRVIHCATDSAEELGAEERDWYKDYEVPDDLMW